MGLRLRHETSGVRAAGWVGLVIFLAATGCTPSHPGAGDSPSLFNVGFQVLELNYRKSGHEDTPRWPSGTPPGHSPTCTNMGDPPQVWLP